MSTAPAHEIVELRVAGRQAFALVSPDGLVATVVPDLAMLCSSLQSRGRELLGFPGSVTDYAARAVQTGIPLLHPWANRLGSGRLVGQDEDTVDPASPLVPTDGNGLAIHGLRLVGAGWTVTSREFDRDRALVEASLDFARDDLLAAFPFPHRLTVATALAGDTLTITTVLAATGEVAVPVSFGWHPYFRLADVPREDWQVQLPVRRRALLDALQLPTGGDVPVDIPPGPLGSATYDDCFTDLDDPAVFSLAGNGIRIEVSFDEGYPVGQVYAPTTPEVIAFEPMTAPVNALVTGDGLRWVQPGASFRASFRIRVVG